MTALTQAQIEAAAKAIRDIEDPEQPIFEFEPAAKAALTAAHEAWLSETFSERWQAAKDRAAAAEVSRPSDEYMRGYLDGDLEHEAATIERCAQVAANWEHDHYGTGKGIAAAIRALKTGKDHA